MQAELTKQREEAAAYREERAQEKADRAELKKLECQHQWVVVLNKPTGPSSTITWVWCPNCDARKGHSHSTY